MGLEDYGGETDDSAPEEPVLDQQTRELIETVYLSDEMRAFIATPVGRALKTKAADRLLDAMTTLLSCADLTHPIAKTAHFNARVATTALQMIDEIILEGTEIRSTHAAQSNS